MIETQNLLSRSKMQEYILYDYVVNHWEKLVIMLEIRSMAEKGTFWDDTNVLYLDDDGTKMHIFVKTH